MHSTPSLVKKALKFLMVGQRTIGRERLFVGELKAWCAPAAPEFRCRADFLCFDLLRSSIQMIGGMRKDLSGITSAACRAIL